ncbi:hypothetical protein DdX_04995 [Ditylenchus destructor]|uniref:Uncharacterized protein n=1 Tax=Ditylenchus destructor TaxID=166010 RepID=A0AAD4N8V6_9BILA|nr:hypothetical protein DdX_04995 [Ditylenchus destructor]
MGQPSCISEAEILENRTTPSIKTHDLDSDFLETCLSSLAKDGFSLLSGDDSYWSDLVKGSVGSPSESIDGVFSDIGDLLEETSSDISSLTHDSSFLNSPISDYFTQPYVPKTEPELITYERESPQLSFEMNYPCEDDSLGSGSSQDVFTNGWCAEWSSIDLYGRERPFVDTELQMQLQIQRNAQICDLLSPIRKYQESLQQKAQKKCNQQNSRRKFSLMNGRGGVNKCGSRASEHLLKPYRTSNISVLRWRQEIWNRFQLPKSHRNNFRQPSVPNVTKNSNIPQNYRIQQTENGCKFAVNQSPPKQSKKHLMKNL